MNWGQELGLDQPGCGWRSWEPAAVATTGFQASLFAHIDPDWGAAMIPITLGTSLAFEEGRLPQRTPGSKSNPNKAEALKGLLRAWHINWLLKPGNQ